MCGIGVLRLDLLMHLDGYSLLLLLKEKMPLVILLLLHQPLVISFLLHQPLLNLCPLRI